jgi:SAM-dependent methyltransferase
MKDSFYIMRSDFVERGLHDLIDHIDAISPVSEMSLLEIGSYTGESTTIFANRFKDVTSIDPFVDDYDPNDDACKYAPFEKVCEKFKERTKDFKNIKHIRKTSDEAFPKLKTKFDVIYIDGLHTYEQVLKDITNYKKLLKPSGFMSGHDYSVENWGGVVRAVLETIGEPDKTFQDTSWLKCI